MAEITEGPGNNPVFTKPTAVALRGFVKVRKLTLFALHQIRKIQIPFIWVHFRNNYLKHTIVIIRLLILQQAIKQ